ncbi:MAG: GAF domain-containing protein, partial [Kovacikia sp.]
MNSEQLAKLRECCKDDAAFEQLQQILAVDRGSAEQLHEQVRRSQQTKARESSMIRVVDTLGQSIIDQIRQSQAFDETLQAMLHEVRSFLNADRVVVYRFYPDWSGEFISESVGDRWTPLMEKQQVDPTLRQNISDCQLQHLRSSSVGYTDTYLQETEGGTLKDHRIFVVSDIYQAGFSDCYIEMLEQIEARAYTSIPIFTSGIPWGLLAAYQNDAPRTWQELEVSLLAQVGNQLGAALQLADSIREAQLQAER